MSESKFNSGLSVCVGVSLIPRECDMRLSVRVRVCFIPVSKICG